ncbi:MAG: class I SAM-dependent methyltransferase [Clostridia bacterium]|nr:class I SAM-dependent methyltransferase [Clostridia bacterium]MBQ3255956.1 class I SAM-dependent methyltransferase [Oscillospiraceae bacterium]
MVDLITLEKQFVSAHIKKGGVCVDFTMGNGHDTSWLSRQVGEEGHVYAFDIQPQALESTRKTLAEDGCPDNCTLICDSHSNVKDYVKEKICAGMFNLGYLPGGDKSITTLRETTIPAVKAGIELLGEDAILLIAVYPGHAEGTAEGLLLDELLATYDRREICISKFKIVNSPTSPFFFICETKPAAGTPPVKKRQ